MIRWLLRLALGGAVLFLALGLMAPLHPAFDAFAQFCLHGTAGLAVMTLAAAGTLPRFWSMAGGLVVTLALVMTWPQLPLPGLGTGDEATGAVKVSIIQLNLRFDNEEIEAARELVRRENPDFWLFQETTDHSGVVLDDLKDTHPVQVRCPGGRVGATTIAARHPLAEGAETLCSAYPGLAAARFAVDGGDVTIASLHLHWPWPFNQYGHIERLTADLQRLEGPVIVAGDFNSAPWTQSVKTVARHSGTRVADGLVLTWVPFQVPDAWTGWVGLPLDNLLHDPAITLAQREILSDAGSDHRPVRSTLILP